MLRRPDSYKLHLLSGMSTGRRGGASRAPLASVLSTKEAARPPHPPHKLLTAVTAHLHASRLSTASAWVAPTLWERPRAICASRGAAPRRHPLGDGEGAASGPFRRCAAAARARTRARAAPSRLWPPLTGALSAVTGTSKCAAEAADGGGPTTHARAVAPAVISATSALSAARRGSFRELRPANLHWPESYFRPCRCCVYM